MSGQYITTRKTRINKSCPLSSQASDIEVKMRTQLNTHVLRTIKCIACQLVPLIIVHGLNRQDLWILAFLVFILWCWCMRECTHAFTHTHTPMDSHTQLHTSDCCAQYWPSSQANYSWNLASQSAAFVAQPGTVFHVIKYVGPEKVKQISSKHEIRSDTWELQTTHVFFSLVMTFICSPWSIHCEQVVCHSIFSAW